MSEMWARTDGGEMKCDELKYERLDDAFETYPDSTLVIRKQYVDAAIAELKAENERLVKCCKEYDSRQRIDETIKFNAAKQTRKMRHALWLLRAENAINMAALNFVRPKVYLRWINIEQFCRTKAEEYK